ncbi:MAG: peptide chain release factor N(5)-glutamine methyltransferase [Longimicrobiales bacterium]|nr:peptide chain release factor N(5)-glutamine methyltransferase [Longimicrobiales bacterium]
MTPSPAGETAAAPGREEGGRAEPWTVLRLIRWSADYLAEHGVDAPRLDAEHLLAHAVGVGRLQLYLDFDRPLDPVELDRFRPLLRRRAAREPLQYIVGRAAFRELELTVDPRVLIPRPETEVLVDHVLAWARGRKALDAADVGTGSGCIALSLLREGPFARVWGVDVSAGALEVAVANARRLPEGSGAFIPVLGAGVAALSAGLQVDVVAANPPYVRDGEMDGLPAEVRDHEPHVALFAGPDGMAVFRTLVEEVPARLRPGGLLALEVGADQGPEVRELVSASTAFHEVALHRDLAGRHRIVTAVCR